MAAPFIHELQAEISESARNLEDANAALAAAESLAEGLAQENTELERELDAALKEVESLRQAIEKTWRPEVKALREQVVYWGALAWERWQALLAQPPLPSPQNPEPSRFRQLLAEAVRELERSPTVQGQTTWTQEGPHSQQQS